MTIDVKPIGYCSEVTLNNPELYKGYICSKRIYDPSCALYDQAAIDTLQARIAELEAALSPLPLSDADIYERCLHDGAVDNMLDYHDVDGDDALKYAVVRLVRTGAQLQEGGE